MCKTSRWVCWYDEEEKKSGRVLIPKGDVAKMWSVLAASDKTPVLLMGETGTGKEEMARVIWAHSKRKTGPFKAVNCGAITPSLLSSELFGHKKGSFTYATDDRAGLFAKANKGTVLLDEIGAAPEEGKASLNRFLETGILQRVGEDNPPKADVRVLAATNEPKKMRDDLRRRFEVLSLPPLRNRRDDISLLLAEFMKPFTSHTHIDIEWLLTLIAGNWAGNIRDLKKYCDRVKLMATTPPQPLTETTATIPDNTCPQQQDIGALCYGLLCIYHSQWKKSSPVASTAHVANTLRLLGRLTDQCAFFEMQQSPECRLSYHPGQIPLRALTEEHQSVVQYDLGPIWAGSTETTTNGLGTLGEALALLARLVLDDTLTRSELREHKNAVTVYGTDQWWPITDLLQWIKEQPGSLSDFDTVGNALSEKEIVEEIAAHLSEPEAAVLYARYDDIGYRDMNIPNISKSTAETKMNDIIAKCPEHRVLLTRLKTGKKKHT